MKKVVSLILILTIILSLSVTSFAREGRFEKPEKLRSSYEINNDGTISKNGKSSDRYSKAINFLIEIGAIEVYKDGTIINNYSEEALVNNTKSKEKANKKIDYNNLYNEAINGKYSGILPEKELDNIIQHVNQAVAPSDMQENEFHIQNYGDPFNYYQTVLSNTVLVSYVYYSYLNIGYVEDLAHLSASIFFAQQVGPNQPWDYKVPLGYNNYYLCNMNTYYLYYSGEEIGNMHYGTVGSYLFLPTTLKVAAGMVQVSGGNFSPSWFATYFDEPADAISVQTGINLHSQYNFPTAIKRR